MRETGLMRGWVLAGGAAVLVVAVGIGFNARGRRGDVAVERPVVVNAVAPVQRGVQGSTVRMIELRRASATPHAVAAVPSESLEMQEMRAASEVAPALPLTDEERLLQKMAHRGDAVLIASAEAMAQEPVEQAVPEKSLKPVFLPGFQEAAEPAAPVVEQTGSGENE